MGVNVPPVSLRLQMARDRIRSLEPGILVFSGFDERNNQSVRFQFRLNPDRLQRSYKKLGKWVLTKFGFERQNWGNDLQLFTYSGTSGVFRPGDDFTGDSFDVRDTPAWKRFKLFEEFFLNTGNSQNVVTMQYWGYDGEFVGCLADFQLTHDVNTRPRDFQYSFRFEGRPERLVTVQVTQQFPSEGNPNNAAQAPIDNVGV